MTAIRPAVALLAAPLTACALITGPAVGSSGAATSSLPDHLRGVHNARQLVVVMASDYGRTTATLRVFVKKSDGWHQVFGPWTAHIGSHGFAPRGSKREGDGRTPTGSFTFPFMFGVAANPGVRFPYRRAVSTSRWDDDSSSANYNRWVDTRSGNPGRAPEDMDTLPQYRYGAVISYNTAQRTPGLGSAIFFHVTDGRATAGCVAITQSHLLQVLRWLRPGLHPRIIMGTRAAITD